MLVYGPGNPQSIGDFVQQNLCKLRVCFGGGRVFFKERLGGRPRRGTRPVSRREPGLGHRSLSGWADRICDQSGKRPRAAHRACDSSDCRERRLGLGLCADSHDWTSRRWRAGWCAVARARDFLIRAESGQISADSWQRFSSEWRTGKNVESAAKKELTKE